MKKEQRVYEVLKQIKWTEIKNILETLNGNGGYRGI
jgi:hypothetical protein